MSYFLRRARFAAASALCLALPAAAQAAERIGETVSSPFGTFQAGWSGALGGAMLKPSGLLVKYAFSPMIGHYNVAAPDETTLHRLAPVAVALELKGVTLRTSRS